MLDCPESLPLYFQVFRAHLIVDLVLEFSHVSAEFVKVTSKMDFPWRKATPVSAVAAYVATSVFKANWFIFAFAGYFFCAYALILFLYSFWGIILYPKVFSPLRGLPEPKNSSWYNGQWKKIRDLPMGVPMEEW